jgi:glycosyltransferase involved in cell wall biosynthesis
MRLCFIADGRSVHTQRWLSEMVARGFDVHVVSNRPFPLDGVVLHELPVSKSALGWFTAIPRLRRLIRRIDPDLVHGHYLTSYGLLAAASGVQPLVLTAWGSDVLVSPRESWLVRLLTGWIIRRADYITADAVDVIDAIRACGPNCPVEQVQWGVELARFAPRQATTSSAPLRFISLRSWEPLYEIATILHAFASVAEQIGAGGCRLDLLGGGSQEQMLRELTRQLGIESRVVFHGFRSEAEMISLLTQADVSISVPRSDGTAMSLLESMAAGLPVIVSDLPANRQWVDADGGYIVPTGNVTQLAQAMLSLATDGRLRLRMGARNRQVVEAHADRRREMDRMAAVYRRLAGK